MHRCGGGRRRNRRADVRGTGDPGHRRRGRWRNGACRGPEARGLARTQPRPFAGCCTSGLSRGRPVSRRRTLPPRRPDRPRDAAGPAGPGLLTATGLPLPSVPFANDPPEESHGQRTEVLHQRCLGRAQHQRHTRRHQSGDQNQSHRSPWVVPPMSMRPSLLPRRPSRRSRRLRSRSASPSRQDHRTDRCPIRGVCQHDLVGDGCTRRPRQGCPGADRSDAFRHGCPDPAQLRVRGAARELPAREGTGRRRGNDHALELAAQPDRLQGRPCARHWLHHGAQAV